MSKVEDLFRAIREAKGNIKPDNFYEKKDYKEVNKPSNPKDAKEWQRHTTKNILQHAAQRGDEYKELKKAAGLGGPTPISNLVQFIQGRGAKGTTEYPTYKGVAIPTTKPVVSDVKEFKPKITNVRDEHATRDLGDLGHFSDNPDENLIRGSETPAEDLGHIGVIGEKNVHLPNVVKETQTNKGRGIGELRKRLIKGYLSSRKKTIYKPKEANTTLIEAPKSKPEEPIKPPKSIDEPIKPPVEQATKPVVTEPGLGSGITEQEKARNNAPMILPTQNLLEDEEVK